MSVYRYPQKLFADPKRVILRFLDVGEERSVAVIDKILQLKEKDVAALTDRIFSEFGNRHRQFEKNILNNFKRVEKYSTAGNDFSLNTKIVIGAYFSKEYSIESAALFNPSLTVHPDQTGLDKDELRFVLSLRATGEGHISSIEFRTGIIDSHGDIAIDPVGKFSCQPEIKKDAVYSKDALRSRFRNTGGSYKKLFNLLPPKFSLEELNSLLYGMEDKYQDDPSLKNAVSEILDFSESNYEAGFEDAIGMSEKVLFPQSKSESAGLEDLRLVRFRDDDGSCRYYGTYTAYNGSSFRVQMLETDDFNNFRINTLHGKAVKDKGMALFPRKINGKYMMITRQGGVNIGIMSSDSLFYWDKYRMLKKPQEPWELIQLGNCGSPLETSEGWLLITHAVGPLRKYVISACLLDLNNPDMVIGTLKEPLIVPEKSEREGYVPNVVYSCGSVLHGENLIIPFAMSDSCTGFAGIKLSDLFERME